MIFAIFDDQEALEINLGFLSSVELDKVEEFVGSKYFWISVVPKPITLLDSWIIYPSIGVLPKVLNL